MQSLISRAMLQGFEPDAPRRCGRAHGAHGARQRNAVQVAVLGEAFAGLNQANDLDQLARALPRPVERRAAPALSNLGRADAEAGDEAVLRHGGERHGGHGGEGRRARRCRRAE